MSVIFVISNRQEIGICDNFSEISSDRSIYPWNIAESGVQHLICIVDECASTLAMKATQCERDSQGESKYKINTIKNVCI